eukprot:scaffold1785_cov95-Isochrysis_galbana.AAC.1
MPRRFALPCSGASCRVLNTAFDRHEASSVWVLRCGAIPPLKGQRDEPTGARIGQRRPERKRGLRMGKGSSNGLRLFLPL